MSLLEEVLEEPSKHADDNEEEATWGGNSPAWASSDFLNFSRTSFEICFILLSLETVLYVYTIRSPGSNDMIPIVQDIYREHGWPKLEQYRKEEYLRVVQRRCPKDTLTMQRSRMAESTEEMEWLKSLWEIKLCFLQ